MKKLIVLSLIIIFALGFLSSCKKKKGTAPTLPPAASMTIDFTNFESGAKSIDFASASKGVENSSWEFSALVAGYWKTIIATTLAVPVASFKIALDQTATWVEEKTWQWNYTVTVLGSTYKARLVGLIQTTDVKWTMYVTKEGTGGFAEFVWFEGTSKIDGTSGQWILNHSSAYKEPVLQIDWTKTGTDLYTVKYTYVRTLNDNRASDTFKGSYIEYGKTSATAAYYTIHYWNGTAFSDMNVEWNPSDKSGRVKCQAFFGDTKWYCWNGNHVNITCPQ